MIRAIALVVIAATALTGCRDASESDSGPLVRDSAGIRIVQNKAPAWSATQAWRIGDARLTIGESESPEQALHLVAGAVRLGDGTIAIANGGSNEIRRYGSDGEYLGAIGRTGEGPGEFRALGWLGRSERDSLIAWDRRLNRLTIFTPSGQYSRSYVPSLPEASAGPAVHGLLWRGRVVLSRGASFAPADGTSGLQRQPLHAWLVSSSGQLEAEHGPFEGEAIDLRPGAQPGTIIRTAVPFGAATLLSAGGDRIYVADNGAYDVKVFEPNGGLVQIVRRPQEPMQLLLEDIAADLEARLARLPPVPEIRAGSRASYEAVPKPAHIPPLRSMLADTEGCLWIEAGRHHHDATATWSVFASDGTWLGDLALAANAQPLEIGRDYVLVLVQDELGVETVSVLSLQRNL